MRVLASVLLALSLPVSFAVPSLAHTHNARRHHIHRQPDLAPRHPGEVDLHKRDGDRFTYYAVGLGACGWTNQDTDFVVALDSAQFDSGHYCGQMITIEANGKSTQAQIVDRCPGCPYGGLDFSQGLFQFFADVSVGVLVGSWSFGSGGSAPSPSPSPSPPPPPPPPPPPATTLNIPLTTWLAPLTTSAPPPTTTSASPTTTPTSVSSSNSSSVATQTTTNGVAITAGTVPQGAVDTSILFGVDSAIVYIGQFLSVCSGL